MENIFKTLYDIGNFVFKLVTFSIGAILDGLAGIFGGADKLKNGNLGGAWDIVQGCRFVHYWHCISKSNKLPVESIWTHQRHHDVDGYAGASAEHEGMLLTLLTWWRMQPDANKARKVTQTPEDLQKAYKLKSLEQAEELDRLIKASGQTAESLSDDAMQALVKQARRNKPAGLLGKAFAGAENLADNVFKSLGDFKNFLGDKAKFYKRYLSRENARNAQEAEEESKGIMETA